MSKTDVTNLLKSFLIRYNLSAKIKIVTVCVCLKSVVDQTLFGHLAQPVVHQRLQDAEPTRVADQSSSADQSPEQAVGAFDATVVPVVPVDGRQRSDHPVHVAGTVVVVVVVVVVVRESAAKLYVRHAVGRREAAGRVGVRRRRRHAADHVADDEAADSPPPLWAAHVEVQAG